MIVVRDDLPLDARHLALDSLAGDDQVARAKLLMQLTKISIFDPDRTSEAIAPLLMDLPGEAVLAINDELNALLDSDTPGLRSAAVALKVRSGSALGELAKRDPVALLDAVASMSPDQTPDTLPNALLELAKSGDLDAGQAIEQASRLSSDKAALFDTLAKLADGGLQVSYDQWGQPHQLAMAALAAMHQTPDEAWPTGYETYRIARADPEVVELGKEKYFHEEKGCVKCHGEHGEGTPGFPPLAQSPMVVGDPKRAATIVKFGLMGALPHSINPADGKPFSAQMEPLSYYNNAEIAAALTYVRQHFGNFAAPVTVEDVAAARPPDEGMMWEASALLSKYPFERDRLSGPLPPPAINIQNWTPPSIGLPLMLVVVGVCMLFILAGTYAGKFLQDPHTPTHAS